MYGAGLRLLRFLIFEDFIFIAVLLREQLFQIFRWFTGNVLNGNTLADVGGVVRMALRGGDIQIPDKLVVDVFAHGWIPGFCDRRGYHYFSDWRECGRAEWEAARWYNGMNCISSTLEEKTIVCGHWHTSYGHCRIEEKCSEFGPDADFSPYIAPGIIAIDACTAHSGIVNCIVIED